MRRAKRTWSNLKTNENLKFFKDARNNYRHHLYRSKCQCINNQIQSCGTDTKKLFNTVNALTGRKRDNPLAEGLTDA